MAWDGSGTETLTVSRERDGSAPGGPVWAMDGSGAMGTIGDGMAGCGTTGGGMTGGGMTGGGMTGGGRPALSPASWPKPAYCALRTPARGASATPAPLANTLGADAERSGEPIDICWGAR